MERDKIQELLEKIQECKEEISKGIIGQKDIVNGVLIGLFSGGNVLLEGVPGLGKTQLVKTLSKVLNLSFSRIQFTPDLMPADVVGTNIIINEDGKNQFEFQRGPVFTNLLLADEINRATPKTQSALLEAMQEKTVTVANETYKLQEPFMVLATQNPIEMEGTYPLPEAQLDRFLFKLKVNFPTLKELMEIMDITVTNRDIRLNEILTLEDIMEIKSIVKEVPMAEGVKEYALKIILATHPELDESPEYVKKYISVGSSPRGAQGVFIAARVLAFMDGRYNVSFQDIKDVVYPILRHRIILNFEGVSEGITADMVIDKIIEEIKVI
ncbi:AAA family ATPase [Clostridium sp. 'White wine YQ']|uniref:AAA family ATPase n=1 Tax=Clostridium sp. 'White wine YQ' TaxID=3027474 RepID=UPI0023664EF3|nr:MoxR family ATPase [Clostridium sp. 'White wine YQ']MDD7792888.1 MoxR family ATPase [Clostridium sp. 'White wine YQ']